MTDAPSGVPGGAISLAAFRREPSGAARLGPGIAFHILAHLHSLGASDLMIASIALAADATLVTRNADEFRRVANLRIEEW